MKILIVEDEPLAAKRLEGLVKSQDPGVEVLARLDSVRDTLEWLSHHPAPDLVFMDVQLADGLCFEIFQETDLRSPVVFTTAYDEYALRAFKVNSVDYLLKPIDTDELGVALAKFKSYHSADMERDKLNRLLESVAPPAHKSRFLIKVGSRFEVVDTRDILYCYAEDKVVFVHTRTNQRYLVDDTLDELERKLSPREFFRLNRRYLSRLSAIERIEPHFNGKLYVRLLHRPVEEEIFVSRSRADAFKKWLDS